jgi:hypothetical protein
MEVRSECGWRCGVSVGRGLLVSSCVYALRRCRGACWACVLAALTCSCVCKWSFGCRHVAEEREIAEVWRVPPILTLCFPHHDPPCALHTFSLPNAIVARSGVSAGTPIQRWHGDIRCTCRQAASHSHPLAELGHTVKRGARQEGRHRESVCVHFARFRSQIKPYTSSCSPSSTSWRIGSRGAGTPPLTWSAGPQIF